MGLLRAQIVVTPSTFYFYFSVFDFLFFNDSITSHIFTGKLFIDLFSRKMNYPDQIITLKALKFVQLSTTRTWRNMN